MSVLIRGMEMPTSCDVCRFAINGFCYASGKVNVSAVEDRQVTNYCPLVPVPPHGRLIDADALAKKMRVVVFRGEEKDVLHHNVKAFLDAPTIIPAEEGET